MSNSALALYRRESTGDSPSIDWNRPLVIGCCPSSGSTLLSVMLDAHPDVLCGPELSLFAHPFVWQMRGEAWRSRLLACLENAPQRPEEQWSLESGAVPFAPPVDVEHLAWFGLDLDKLRALVACCEGVEELVQGMFESALRRTGKRIWAEKSPPNLYAVENFLACYPHGRAVLCVRDGRDVVCSLMKRGFTLAEASSIWLVEASRCLRLSRRPNVHLLRYEDLVISPETTTAELLDALDLAPATEAMLRYGEHSDRATSDASIRVGSWNARPTGGFDATSVGRWRSELSLAQLEFFYRHHLRNADNLSCDPVGDVSDDAHPISTVDLLTALGYDRPEARLVDRQELGELLHSERVLAKRSFGADHLHRSQTHIEIDAELYRTLAERATSSLAEAEAATKAADLELQNAKALLQSTEASRSAWEENWRQAQHQANLLEIALQNSLGNRARRTLRSLQAWFAPANWLHRRGPR